MVYVEPSNDAVVAVGELLSEQACTRFERALDALRGPAADPVGPTTLSGPRDIATVDVSGVSIVAERAIDLLFALWLDLHGQGRALRLVAPDHVWNMLGEAAVNRALGRRTTAAPEREVR